MALSMLMLAGAPLSAAEPENAVQADWILDKLARRLRASEFEGNGERQTR